MKDVPNSYTDELRTPEWELKGLRFLAKINPRRYTINMESFLDGAFKHYLLTDKETGTQIGNTIAVSAVSGRHFIANEKI